MSKDGPSVYDGLKYLYAEQLHGKRVKLTIKSIEMGAEFFHDGRKTVGFDIAFEGTDKLLGVTGATVRRQLYMATGTENPNEMKGKSITLYPVQSKRSATGLAIRIAVPEQFAQ